MPWPSLLPRHSTWPIRQVLTTSDGNSPQKYILECHASTFMHTHTYTHVLLAHTHTHTHRSCGSSRVTFQQLQNARHCLNLRYTSREFTCVCVCRVGSESDYLSPGGNTPAREGFNGCTLSCCLTFDLQRADDTKVSPLRPAIPLDEERQPQVSACVWGGGGSLV